MNKVLIDTNIYSCAMRGDSSVTIALHEANHIGYRPFPLVSDCLVSEEVTRNRKTVMSWDNFLIHPVAVSIH